MTRNAFVVEISKWKRNTSVIKPDAVLRWILTFFLPFGLQYIFIDTNVKIETPTHIFIYCYPLTARVMNKWFESYEQFTEIALSACWKNEMVLSSLALFCSDSTFSFSLILSFCFTVEWLCKYIVIHFWFHTVLYSCGWLTLYLYCWYLLFVSSFVLCTLNGVNIKSLPHKSERKGEQKNCRCFTSAFISIFILLDTERRDLIFSFRI